MIHFSLLFLLSVLHSQGSRRDALESREENAPLRPHHEVVDAKGLWQKEDLATSLLPGVVEQTAVGQEPVTSTSLRAQKKIQ